MSLMNNLEFGMSFKQEAAVPRKIMQCLATLLSFKICELLIKNLLYMFGVVWEIPVFDYEKTS